MKLFSVCRQYLSSLEPNSEDLQYRELHLTFIRELLRCSALTHPLLVFALLCHLIPQVCQLRGELLDQCLSLIQLKSKHKLVFAQHVLMFYFCSHLSLECLPLVLFPVHILDSQGNRPQSRKPVQTLVLNNTKYFRLTEVMHFKCHFNLD